MAGKPPKFPPYKTADLQTQLKVLTRRLGNLGFPFDDQKQTLGALRRERTIVGNAWAHGDPFTALDAWRSHDYCVRLLEYFNDGEGLVKASGLRQEAFMAYVDEQGIAPAPATTAAATVDYEPVTVAVDDSEADSEPDLVAPDPEVFAREPEGGPSVVGNERLPFQSWTPVIVGDVSVLDDLPKVAGKQKVRAVAAEVDEEEGPIHIDRLAQMVAASFGVQKLHSERAAKIAYQVKASGLLIDKAKFVWPEGVTPDCWQEFRPSSSQVDRPFLQISPIEIANVMRFLLRRRPGLEDAELETATLQTFGCKKRTKQFVAHLTKAKELL